jgi:proprotein convertase subtilisin/kexin type 5
MCLTCSDGSTCLQCEKGYYVNAANTCALCSALFPNCYECSSTVCYTCNNQFFESGGACLPCGTGCLSCINSADNCLSCLWSWYSNYPTANTCTACPGTCNACEGTRCYRCKPGSYRLFGNCLPCHASCLDCNGASDDNCLSCHAGFTINSAN